MVVRLNAVEQGAGPPVVILHGLFGSARNWASVAKRLSEAYHVYAVDLRNHGASPWAETMSYDEMAADVHAFLLDRRLGRVALIGHSMGGKAAMLTALRHPEAVDRLVVVDIAPAAYPATLLAYVQAMRRIDLGGMTRRGEADAPLSEAVPDPAERQFLLQNILSEAGRLRWRINLPAIERAMPGLSGFPDLPGDRVYAGPTLFVAGGRSDHLRPEHHGAIARLFPKAGIVEVPEAGHWVHAEQPEPFLAVLDPFLARGG